MVHIHIHVDILFVAMPFNSLSFLCNCMWMWHVKGKPENEAKCTHEYQFCGCTVYAYLLDAQTCPGVDLNLEDVTGCPNKRNYICPGEMVQYECGNNISTAFAWDEGGGSDPSLFNCSPQNIITITPATPNAVCGAVSGTFVNTANGCSRSRVMFEAATSLNGTIVRCRDGLSAQVMVLGTDEVVIVGMLTIKECI